MMALATINPLTCGMCQKEFTSVSVRNRHLRQFHNEDIQNSKNKHVICCLCPADNADKFSSYKNYDTHLLTDHNINVTENIFHFRNSEEFEMWRGQENRAVDYASIRCCKKVKGETYTYYHCNRSNYKGFKSVCERRKKKVAGSIHIQGSCPSRIVVKISIDGLHSVNYVETHVGHDDSIRTKRLTKCEQNHLVEKLAAGIPKERIMKDARNAVHNEKLERFNVITRADLSYLVRKHNIDKIRDHEEKRKKPSDTLLNSDEEIREIAKEKLNKLIDQLSGDDLHKFLSEVWTSANKITKDNEQICQKRKIEKQSYLPKQK